MNDNIDFKDLWQTKVTETPDIKEVYYLINKEKKRLLKRLIATNIIYFLTATYIMAIWVYYKPQLLSTKIGISVSILAISIFILAQNQMLPLLKKVNSSMTVSDYVDQFNKVQRKEKFLQTTMMNIYLVLLALGIFIYMYEYVAKTVVSVLLTYGITSGWFAFNWFYLRPKTIKKQQAKTNDLIAKLETFKNQLTDA